MTDNINDTKTKKVLFENWLSMHRTALFMWLKHDVKNVFIAPRQGKKLFQF